MSSERRIESSQANGALSNGPITPEGKRRSSRNAEKHGVHSCAVVINGESMERFLELRAVLFARYRPGDPFEEHLVDELVACRWRMNRMASLEAAALDHKMDCQQADIEESFESIDPSTRAVIALQSLTDTSNVLATCRRFESALARQYERAARHLSECQAKKQKLNNEPSPTNEHN